MIYAEQLENMAGKLKVYDVDQKGWEHEGQGLKINTRHVYIHIANSLANKNFNDHNVVQTEIAPDSVQYALRIGRWTKTKNFKTMLPRTDLLFKSNTRAALESISPGEAAFKEAVGTLGKTFHDLEHESSREEASQYLIRSARHAASFLIISAGLQAEEHGFDIEEVMENRLTVLRERFDIPEPQA